MARPKRGESAGGERVDVRVAGGDFAARVLEAARAAACRAAEVFIKSSASRQVAWEPPLRDAGPAHIAASNAIEAGAGLLVVDSEGRSGLAWRSGGPTLLTIPDAASIAGLVGDALAAARAGGAAPGAAAAADGRRDADSDATTGADIGPVVAESLDLVDPACLGRPETALVAILEAAALEVAAAAEGALEVDRILVTEARTSVRLARLDGYDGAYERTIAALSIALVPAVAGAEAVTEERSACRLDDLDPRQVARDAILRGLPPRTKAPAPPPADPKPAIVLAPRAAATLLSALAPWVTTGAVSVSRPSALSIVDDGLAPGRPGSAPFDGSGRPARRIPLLDRGRAVGRVAPDSGPFQRPSYRDLPVTAPAGLAIVPGRRRDDRAGASGAGPDDARGPAAPAPAAYEPSGPVVRAAVIEVRTGAQWVVQIRRGEWGSGAAADGLYWEGTPAALVQAVVATLDDPAYYQVGLPVAAPSVVLEGLGPWRQPGANR